ncbi:hypothetical protein PoB_004132000 [Plakobranchus ocellatus]|uniref:Uncharacterized protein n=1 Tax=Plakobranchus ocellatus TaxID=259542 RepID=A0AAV4B2H5_9GAST|nr:hypothetical protein PoB_004132000 [Plakobranchus ocellatus]
MFTIKFKRELIRCCYCLQGTLRRKRQEDSYGLRRSLLFPWKRTSESSSSSRNDQRLGLSRTHGVDTTSNQLAQTQSCRFSFVSPLADVKASSSRASLSSVGREERVSFVGYSRDDRVSFGTTMLGVPGALDRPGLSPSFSAYRDDRANLNNFVRLGSVE